LIKKNGMKKLIIIGLIPLFFVSSSCPQKKETKQLEIYYDSFKFKYDDDQLMGTTAKNKASNQ
jgi:hypothetical protein